MSTRRSEAVVIGGGPAGMMAAITAARRGRDVVLLEHQKFCGKKLRITGKGRCNVCNDCEKRDFLKNVPGNPKFLYSALDRFGPSDTMAFFEELGVPLKTERGNRVFPVSDNAHDVARALEREMKRCGVRLWAEEEARRVLTREGAVCGVETDRGTIDCESVLLATGGMSYPLTGSTGDGYRMARELGHSVTPLRPSLIPLECAEPDCAELQGFSLKNVTLTALEGDRIVFSELGELMFTHFGVTGPLVLSASSHMRDYVNQSCRLWIDLKPALDPQTLDARLLRDFEKYRNRDFRNALDDLAGRSMIPVLIRRSGIPEDTKVHSITREQRRRLGELLKRFELTVTGPRPIEEAIVTAGGVAVGEVNPRTLESKLVRGLHFAGELLDLDAYTGGYNLQIAWSTRHLAGENL